VSREGDLRGRLLVATPLIADPNFERTVVLVLEHDAADGAIAVVVNRPSDLEVAEALEGWRAIVSEPRVIFFGGPVSQGSAIALAEAPGVQAEWFSPVIGPVGMVDLDTEPAVVGPSVTRARVFSGYAGWAAGQLEAEIDDGSWFVVDPSPDDALGTRRDELWHEVLRRQGGRVAWFSQYPDDVSDN
jgi:putative transcriptional regulator